MQLSPRIFGRKAPFDFGAGRIARFFQLLAFMLERPFIWDAPRQALTTEDTQLYFGDVQPTAMAGRIVKLQLSENAPGCFGRECLIERSRLVGVQVVHHDSHPLGFRIAFIHQPLHLLREVLHRPLIGDSNVPPTALRLTHHEQVADPVAPIFIIEAFDLSRTRRERHTSFSNQLFARLIKAERLIHVRAICSTGT